METFPDQNPKSDTNWRVFIDRSIIEETQRESQGRNGYLDTDKAVTRNTRDIELQREHRRIICVVNTMMTNQVGITQNKTNEERVHETLM